MENNNDRKKSFYNCLKNLLLDINLPNSKKKVTKGELDFTFNDGVFVRIDFTTFATYCKKGEFSVYVGLTISDGEIYKSLLDTGLYDIEYKDRRYFTATHYNVFPDNKSVSYDFFENTDTKELVKIIVDDISRFFFPIIAGFRENYSYILDNYNLHIPRIFSKVTNPFAIGVLLCLLNKEEDRINEIVSYAKENPDGYYDYKNSTNPNEEIIIPLKRWVVNNAVKTK